MPRPKLVSDDAVIDATRRLMLRDATFTLTDVANDVGLSRAAVIQRFGNRAGLEARVAERGFLALQDAIATHPIGIKGPHAVLSFSEAVLAAFDIQVLTADAVSATLLSGAIVARLDEPSRLRADDVADTLMAVLQGAGAQGKGNAHVLARLKLALKLIYAGP